MEYTPAEEEILNEYYPGRTQTHSQAKIWYEGCPNAYEKNDMRNSPEWEWAGEEYDELIPWTFSSSDNIGEEEFLVLHNAWNCESSLSFTSTDRFPPVEDSIHESYEYIVKLHNKLWRVSITENMGVHGVWCVQSNLEHIKIEDIKIEVHGESWSESQPNTE